MRLADLCSSLTDLALPPQCVRCKRGGAVWCPSCRPAHRPEWRCHGKVKVVAAGDYAGALRAALIAYKERNVRALAPLLADYLASAVALAAVSEADVAGGEVVLVPVPGRRSAARQRGGDHVLRLALVVARRTGRRVEQPLRLSGPVADSAGLSATERTANLDRRMRARPPDASTVRAVPLLVDDIVTTGATLSEASRALEAAGWSSSRAAVIAATARRTDGASRPRSSESRAAIRRNSGNSP